MQPTRDDCLDAHARIRPYVRRTPTLMVAREDLGLSGGGAPVALKLDLLQPTGSFKVRGASALLTAVDVPAAGVVAASGGNFGLAIAYAARRLGLRATVVVPATSPAAKIDPIRRLGAEVVVVEGHYAQALAEAERRLAVDGGIGAHAYDQVEVVAGQGTAALELCADAALDTVIVACGGGGLLAGTIAAVDEHVRVVAVETEHTATLHTALAAGEPVDVEVAGIAASALGARRIGSLAWAVQDRIAGSVLVTDEQVVAAQTALWQATRLITEPGGAAAFAALASGAYRAERDERIGILVCGANTDPGAVLTSPS
jgi:threonine dehydratase